MLDAALARFLAQTFNASILSSSRPGLTFAAIQWTIGVMARQDLLTIAPSLEWLISVPALLIAALFAGLETWTRHDPDAAELLRELKLDHLTGAFGVFSSALLFASLGLPEGEAQGLINTQDQSSSEIALAISMAAAAEQPMPVKIGVVSAAVALHGAITLARTQIMNFIADFELEAVWARLETGSAVGLLVAMLLAPYLATAFLILATVILFTVALTVRAARHAADRRCRVQCPSCGHAVRPEARRCTSCSGDLIPTRMLSRSSIHRGWSAVAQRISAWRHPATG